MVVEQKVQLYSRYFLVLMVLTVAHCGTSEVGQSCAENVSVTQIICVITGIPKTTEYERWNGVQRSFFPSRREQCWVEGTRHFGPEEVGQLAEITGMNIFSKCSCRVSFLYDFGVPVQHVRKFGLNHVIFC
jgi:hypothetical protein